MKSENEIIFEHAKETLFMAYHIEYFLPYNEENNKMRQNLFELIRHADWIYQKFAKKLEENKK